jgi:hypothetical protein
MNGYNTPYRMMEALADATVRLHDDFKSQFGENAQAGFNFKI